MSSNLLKYKADKLLQQYKPEGGNLSPEEFNKILDALERELEYSSAQKISSEHAADQLPHHQTNNDFLAQTAIELIDFTDLSQIYQYVADKLYEILDKKAIITIVDYEVENNTWSMQAFRGIDKLNKLSSLIGYNFTSMSGKTNTPFFKDLSYGKLTQLPLNFHELTEGKISNALGNRIQKLFSIHGLYCILFKKKDSVFGNISIFPRSKKTPIDNHLIEAFIAQVSNFVEKLNAKRILKESEAKYRAIYETSPNAICISNLNGKLVDVNPEFEALTGYSSNELINHNIGDLNISDSTQSPDHPFDKLITRPEDTNNIETGIISKNDINKKVLFFSRRITFNEEAHVLSIIEDITPLKEKEEELKIALQKAQESDRLKSAFLTNISHEIRTPMNGVIGFSQLLRSASLSEEEKEEFLQLIEESGKRMINLLHNLVDISMIHSGNIQLNQKSFQLNEVIDELHQKYSQQAAQKEIKLETQKGLPDEKSQIITDLNYFTGIYKNLLNNALKYTSEGRVRFGYYMQESEPVFYVSDTGIGIPEQMHDKIFEHFRQVHNDLDREYEGAGLGLSIAKAYVLALGGNIWLHSKENHGSTFYFTIQKTTTPGLS